MVVKHKIGKFLNISRLMSVRDVKEAWVRAVAVYAKNGTSSVLIYRSAFYLLSGVGNFTDDNP